MSVAENTQNILADEGIDARFAIALVKDAATYARLKKDPKSLAAIAALVGEWLDIPGKRKQTEMPTDPEAAAFLDSAPLPAVELPPVPLMGILPEPAPRLTAAQEEVVRITADLAVVEDQQAA